MNEIVFLSSAEEEIASLRRTLELANLAEAVASGKTDFTENERTLLANLIAFTDEIFSLDIPTDIEDPAQAIRLASTEVNLSRFLREKGVFRLYMLVRRKIVVTEDMAKEYPHLKQGEEVPLYMMFYGDNGEPFTRQEDLIGWFCEKASFSRASAFTRISAIEKMENLGYDLQKIFEIIIKKPYAIRNALNLVGKWRDGELEDVDTNKARKLAETYGGDKAEHINKLADKIDSGDYDQEDYNNYLDSCKPMVRDLIDDIDGFEHAGDAMAFIAHDLFSAPEVNYRWDMKLDTLVIEVIMKSINDNGTESVDKVAEVVMYPDNEEMIFPQEIKDDLIRRLPIRNRRDLE